VKPAVILLSFLLFWQPTSGQFVDSFDDGNLEVAPEWTGTSANFSVEAGVLKLNAAPVTSVSYLSTPSSSINDATWQFDVVLDFNPSSSNYLKIYLVSDQADLNLDLNGYYIQIGGTPDEVSLYYQSNDEVAEIIDGTDKRLDLSKVNLSVRATRDNGGNWTLFSKLISESSWYQEGAVLDNNMVATNFFGVVCTYTSTRSTKFSFDNFSVSGDPYTDTSPPEITDSRFLNNQQLSLSFNESIDSISSNAIENYLLNNLMRPASILWQDTLVVLTFNNSFELNNSLHLTGIEDNNYNKLDTIMQIVYVEDTPAQTGDIVINELMPDPTPREDLPEAEFVELRNNSNKVIDLQGWQLGDLVSTALLDEYLLFPDSLVIVCANKDGSLFEAFGNVVTVSNWPSLNNSGDHITLKDPTGTMIDQVNYSSEWYNDNLKKDGGWTLELIFPGHKCSSNTNWAASTDAQGGTPGTTNATFIPKDNIHPFPLNHQIFSDSVNIFFNESIQINLARITLAPSDANLAISQNNNKLKVSFNKGLKTSEPFLLTISGILDCNGNESELIDLEFIIPDKSGYTEVLINEVLFNPRTDGVDFIELYNPTDKYFDLTGWVLGNGKQFKTLTNEAKLLSPKSYIVLTGDTDILAKQYPKGVIGTFLNTDTPTMNNDEGSVAIWNNEQVLLDSMVYSEAQHFELINDVEGVSLERVSISVASAIKGNWQSAASTVGFATPGYENSQAALLESASVNFSVDPAVIVPDNTGQDDFTTLYYEFNQAGFVANIDVYNLNGHLIKEIANNESLGISGFFTWNGTNDQEAIVPIGHYLIVAELFNPDGQKKIFRQKIVVGAVFLSLLCVKLNYSN